MTVRPGHRRDMPRRANADPLRAVRLLVVLAVAALAVACSGSSGSTSGSSTPGTVGRALFRPTVVATTDVVASLVSAVGGDEVDVVPLLLRGQVAAAVQPNETGLERARSADLVVAVGGGWEPWLDELGEPPVLELAPLLNPIPLGGSELSGASAPTDAIDPRFWLDPDRTAQAARRLADELAAHGVDRTELDRRVDALAAALAEADEDAQDVLGPIPPDRRTLYAPVAHPGYLADRYGFSVVRQPGPPAPNAEVVDAATTTAGTAPPTDAGVPVVVLHLDALAPTGEPIAVPQLIAGNARALAAVLG